MTAVILNLKSIVMKKVKTIFAAVAILLATSAFATGSEKVSAQVKLEFEKNFTGAVNVRWDKSDDFYFASFMLNSKEVSAAYSENGELLGISRVIATSDLPLSVLLAINCKYENYTIAKTATELTYDGQTSYAFFAENSKQILRLKCNSSGYITVDSKTKK